jgi:A/G-specific adenine glycosylase
VALSAERIARIRSELRQWFSENARDLPWRRTRDPYAILVSEVMLQQTQVDRVAPYYERFLERFPTVSALAAAPAAEVIRLWSGLGYNRRAVQLQRAAQTLVAQYGGRFPEDPETLRTLPGIGAYTAGAVAAFAFEQDVAFLDTNMRRVVNRVVFGVEPVAEATALAAARALAPIGDGWLWNQALIEFGALQCTARRPACVVCPLQRDCAAFPGVQTQIAVARRPRSARQGEPFTQSTRYFRGRIVEALRSLPEDQQAGIELWQLGSRVREGFTAADLPWLRELVGGLQRDGLAIIAEEAPAYDAEMDSELAAVRVRLP